MPIAVEPTAVPAIVPWRVRYRQEMACQILHDSLHARDGWTEPYLLRLDGAVVGYGSVAVAGQWAGTRTLFEWYVAPERRTRTFDLFEALVAASGATHVETQSNDALLAVMLHACCADVATESIVFRDGGTTALPPPGALLRAPAAEGGEWHLEVDGAVAATGGILFHYNPPYGDLYMEVAEPFRRRGLGSYLVQELKRACYELGRVPGARCAPANVASRRTLQKAGFVPVAHRLTGRLVRPPPPPTTP